MASSMKRAQTFSSPQDGTRPRVPMRNQTMRLVRLCYISECQILKRFYWGSHIRMSHLAKGLQTLGWVTLMCDHPIEGNNCRKMNLLRSKMSENDTKKVQKCQTIVWNKNFRNFGHFWTNFLTVFGPVSIF